MAERTYGVSIIDNKIVVDLGESESENDLSGLAGGISLVVEGISSIGWNPDSDRFEFSIKSGHDLKAWSEWLLEIHGMIQRKFG